MTRTVILFTQRGTLAGDLLAALSARFVRRGLAVRGIDLADPALPGTLDDALGEDVAFACGLGGAGARLQIEGHPVWSMTRIPFVSVLDEAPFSMPVNHHVRSPWVVNGYVVRDWLDLQRLLVRSPQICATLPRVVAPNPSAHRPHGDRPNRMVCLQTGADPARWRTRWAGWPLTLRAVLNDCADALAAGPAGPVHPVALSALAALPLLLDGPQPVLFGLLHELDGYMQALRAQAIVTALLPLPVDIVGDGWEYLAASGAQDQARARFHPALDAASVAPLLAETQVLVTAPAPHADGMPEAALLGLAARCRVLGGASAGTRAAALTGFDGFEWTDPGLTDRFAAALDAPSEAPAPLSSDYDPERLIDTMLQLSDMASLQEQMAGYALDAA